MARNDTTFRTVGAPQLNLNASLVNTGIGAINKGLEAFKGIGQDFVDVGEKNRQVKRDVDLSNLKKLADEHLGGPLAGESLEDYDATLNEFLAENGALTGSLGTKALNSFRDDFEKKLTAERNTAEARETTLEQKRRADIKYERDEAAFAEAEKARKEAKAAREYAAGYQANIDGLRSRINDPSNPLTNEELMMLSPTGSVNRLEQELRSQFPNAPQTQIDDLVERRSRMLQRLVQTPEQKTALANAQKAEQRAYEEKRDAVKFRQGLNKERYSKLLEQEPAYSPGDAASGIEEYRAAVAALNEDGVVGDDVINQVQEVMQQYLGQRDQNGNQLYHASDIAKALASLTEPSEDILFIRWDETLDSDALPQALQAAKDGRLYAERQRALIEASGGDGTSVSTPTAPAAPATTTPPPAGAPDPVQAQIAQLQAAAAAQAQQAQTPPPVPLGEEAAAAEKEAELVPPVKAKTPAELKAVAINQLTKAEAPKVEANLEEALKKLPKSGRGTGTQDILRKELISKLAALRDRIEILEEPVAPKGNSGRLPGPL